MRIAVAHWGERISPVFDVTDNLYLIDIEDGMELRREDRMLTGRNPFQRAREVSGLGVDVLVCGAISRMQETALLMARIQVAGFICGWVNDVVESFLCSRLSDGRFLMPGCCGNRQRQQFRGQGVRHRWGRRK
jgi:predicted Fe-Mo cluster-binding NifX family protein